MAKTPTEIKSLARSHTHAALNCLASIIKKKSATDSAKVAASIALLDRGWGKPPQALTGGDEEDNPIKLVTRIERVIVPAKPEEE